MDILSVLKIPSFAMLWLGQIFSQIAINMLQFILILRVFELTLSNTAVSGIILALNVPAAFVGLLAGVFVDRRDKKQILILCNVLRSLLLLILIANPFHLPLIYLVAFLVSFVTQFFVPAEAPMIPKLVSKKMLIPANALFTTSMYSSILVGYVLAGPALRVFGSTIIYVLLALLFMIAAIFVSMIQVKKEGRTIGMFLSNIASGKRRAGVYLTSLSEDLREGYRLLKKSREVFSSLLLLSFSQVMILVFGALLPGYATTVLNIEAEDLSLVIFAPAALGMVGGSLLVGQIGQKIASRFLINLGILASGILVFFLPFSNRYVSKFAVLNINAILPQALEIDLLHVVILIALLLGVANALITVCANATLQGETHERLRGRVYGAFISLSAILSIIPVAAAGSLADLFGVGKILTVLGISITFIGLYRIISGRYTH